jgi:flavin reductase (DIM6/NTAB) family NADH-FMN oxidoreductase RutF
MAELLVDEFKQAMRRFASTVAIITTVQDGERVGMAATAVSSVSTDPPSLVISINRQASIHDCIAGSGLFCVNMLSPSHNDLIPPFSGKVKGEARFAHGEWEGHDLGLPCLKDALASLACVVDAQMTYASHTLFVGRVEAIRMAAAAEPLVWHDGHGALPYPLGVDPAEMLRRTAHA